ncbi:MAG: plastocyanin/azurin family copper-binding protein [Thermoleophilaceae bacterium]
MKALVAAAAATALLSASPASAAVPVDIQFQAFAPSSLDVLPGETVEWSNVSERPHTVTADDDSFDSDEIEAGDRFGVTFPAVGAYRYHCRLHAGMEGEVDVRRVTMGTLPIGLVESGERIPVDGRTADPSVPVQIERSTGADFETVATVTPDADGTWQGEIVAEETAEYRARIGTDVSDTRDLLVSDKRVIVRARRGGRLSVRVVPPNPYGRIMLELRLRERFGWWPQTFKRLDYLSRASFRVNRRVRARVSLVDRDGWTRLAISPVVRLR